MVSCSNAGARIRSCSSDAFPELVASGRTFRPAWLAPLQFAVARHAVRFGLYGASKFALEALSDSYRYELSQLDIEVAVVHPSAYPTNFYSSTETPADPQRSIECGKIGQIS